MNIHYPKILMANNYFYIRGGSERYYFYLMDLLREKGHEVVPFSTKNRINMASLYEDLFADEFDPDKLALLSLRKKIKIAFHMIYSLRAEKRVGNLIDRTKPHITHVHNIYGALTPSILKAFKKRGLPVVMTVHDLKLLCPNHRMYVKQAICERCKISKYYQCTMNKCVNGSRLQSLFGSLESYIHNIMKIYKNNIDLYITPSEFFRKKLIEYDYPKEKIVMIPNFIQADDYDADFNNHNYIIYFGRLEDSKGVNTLIEAASLLKGTIDFILVGGGPLEAKLKYIVEKQQLNHVKIVGQRRRGKELNDLIKNAMFSIVPSELYENNPYAIFEAYACGKPVIGSNIGGIPELIDDGKTGLLFEAGNASDLAEKIKIMLSDPKLPQQMGQTARKKVEEEFGPEKHYNEITSVYKKVMESRK